MYVAQLIHRWSGLHGFLAAQSECNTQFSEHAVHSLFLAMFVHELFGYSVMLSWAMHGIHAFSSLTVEGSEHERDYIKH